MTYDEHQADEHHGSSAPKPSRARAKRGWLQEALIELEDLADLDAYEGLPEARL